LGDGVGYIRIASWPGILGLDVARETDEAIKKLKAKRLLVDLRGNLGSAGAGNLRLMSYLTPQKIPVGYSLTRKRAEAGYDRDCLARFDLSGHPNPANSGHLKTGQ
jgi:C-terminal processing protease CtpA/Prc